MPKQTHWVWDKVTVLAKKGKTTSVICQYCNGRFNVGSVTRIADHLRGDLFALRSGVQSCKAVPENVKNILLEEYDEKAKRLRFDKSKANENERAVGASSNPLKRSVKHEEENLHSPRSFSGDPGSNSGEIELVGKKRQDSKVDVDKALLKGLLSAGISFNILKNHHFATALAAIGKYGPNYLPPSLESAYGKLMASVGHTVNEEVKMRLSSANFTGGTLILHRWEEDGKDTIIDFVFYTPSGGAFLQRMKNNLAENVVDCVQCAVQRHIDNIGADRVVQLITDSSSNMTKVRRIIESSHPHIFCRPSISQSLRHLMVDLSRAVCFGSIFADMRMIVRILKSDPKIGQSFSLQPDPKACEVSLPKLQTVEDLFLVHQNMDKILKFFSHIDIGGLAQESPWRESYEQTKARIQSLPWWETVKAAMQIFQPILKFNRFVESAVACGGKIYANWLEVSAIVDWLNGLGVVGKEEVRQIIEKHWRMSAHDIDAAAFALDPEFWDSQWTQETNSDIMKALQNVFHMLLDDPDREASAMSSWVSYRMKQGPFGDAVVLRSSQMMPAFKWWISYASVYPDLQSVAKKVLGQVQGGGLVHQMSLGVDDRPAYQHSGDSKVLMLHHNLQLAQNYVETRMNCTGGNPLDTTLSHTTI